MAIAVLYLAIGIFGVILAVMWIILPFIIRSHLIAIGATLREIEARSASVEAAVLRIEQRLTVGPPS